MARIPLPCINTVDAEPAPTGFEWSEAVDEPDESGLQLGAEGCACAGGTCSASSGGGGGAAAAGAASTARASTGAPAGAAASCPCLALNQLGVDTLGPDGRLLPLALGIDFEDPLQASLAARCCRVLLLAGSTACCRQRLEKLAEGLVHDKSLGGVHALAVARRAPSGPT